MRQILLEIDSACSDKRPYIKTVIRYYKNFTAAPQGCLVGGGLEKAVECCNV